MSASEVGSATVPGSEAAAPAAVARDASDVVGDPRRIAAPVLEGFLDAVERKRVYGWVHDPDHPARRARVEVCLDGERLGEVLADRERQDLREAGIGDGRYAFEFSFASPLDPAQLGCVSATAIAASGARTVLERFEQGEGSTPVMELGALKLALGKVAAHQIRAFAQHGASMDGMSLKLEDLERRLRERPRFDASSGDPELDQRLRTLEGMHLRFDQALLRLCDERDLLAGERARWTQHGRWLRLALALTAGFGLGVLLQWWLQLLGR